MDVRKDFSIVNQILCMITHAYKTSDLFGDLVNEKTVVRPESNIYQSKYCYSNVGDALDTGTEYRTRQTLTQVRSVLIGCFGLLNSSVVQNNHASFKVDTLLARCIGYCDSRSQSDERHISGMIIAIRICIQHVHLVSSTESTIQN